MDFVDNDLKMDLDLLRKLKIIYSKNSNNYYCRFYEKLKKSKVDVSEIEKLLQEINIYPNEKIYDYFKLALLKLDEEPLFMFQILNLYEHISNLCNKKIPSVIKAMNNGKNKKWDSISFEQRKKISNCSEVQNLGTFITQLYMYVKNKSFNNIDFLEKNFEEVIFKLNITPNYEGYYYLFDILNYVLLNGMETLEDTSKIYEHIAKLYNIDTNLVKRNLGTVKKIWRSSLGNEIKCNFFPDENLKNRDFLVIVYFEFIKKIVKEYDQNYTIIQMLYEMYIWPSNKGCKYIFSALKLLMHDENFIDSVTAMLSKVGDAYNVSYENVEKNIRILKKYSWNHIDLSKKKELFKTDILPKNSSFIYSLYEILKNKEEQFVKVKK